MNFGDNLVFCQRGFKHTGEKIICLYQAFAGLDTGGQCQYRCRITGGRIIIGQRAAYCAAIAHLAVTNAACQPCQYR